MYAVRAGGQRDVEPIVDDNTRLCPSDDVEKPANQPDHPESRQIVLSRLDEIDAGIGSPGHEIRQAFVNLRFVGAHFQPLRQATPISDETNERTGQHRAVCTTL